MSAPAPQDPSVDSAATIEESLYEVRKKIHPRAVTGVFATWRWAIVWLTQIIFYGFAWMPWNGRQAILLELAERKFYVFGLILWPQDVFFLAILLIIAAYSLFLVTAVGGRVWCGYACPQTVYTEIFMWIEMKLEGDRNARVKLDAAPWSTNKLLRRGGKLMIWGLLAAWTGFTFVGYFSPIKTLWGDLWSLRLSAWEIFWMLFYGGFTYLMAGHMREQVCIHMCPYARFQGVMFDPDTLVITYDVERGEPRGARKKGVDPRSLGKGDCVDCSICVQVCPTGIDIRDGLQYECIGCSACIDACDQVMDRVGYPRGLIRYTTEHAIERHWGWKEIVGHIVRPRIVIYSSILAAICLAFVWGLVNKSELRVDVIRDRATLAREVEGELIENVYRLHVMNVSEELRRFAISVAGMDGIELVGERIVELPAAGAKSVSVQVRVPVGSGKKGSNAIYFDVRSMSDNKVAVHEKASFLQP